jgi:hypothetical protein
MMDDNYIPSQFDVLLTDVKSKDLHHDISRRLNTAYLSDTSVSEHNETLNEVRGIVWGPHNRIFVPMIVKLKGKKKMIHFLLDTGSPKTYLSQEALSSFNVIMPNPNNPISVYINGRRILSFQSPENSHFDDINIIGSDYLKTFNAILTVNYQDDSAFIVLPIEE